MIICLDRRQGMLLPLLTESFKRTENLEHQPRRGSEVPKYADESLREVFEHPYRILYRVIEDEVQVVAVIHAARQLPRMPPG